MRGLFFSFLLCTAILSCTSAQNTKEMKSMSTAEIVSIADTFKLADDVLIPYRVGDKFGFCDKDRNIVIEPKYTMATPFSNGYAGVVIKPEDSWQSLAGYINRNGEMVTGFDYTFIKPFEKNGRAVVRNMGLQYGVINTEGEYVIPPVFENLQYYEGLDFYEVDHNGKYGLVDKDNNVKLLPEAELIRYIEGDDILVVKMKGKWGAYNKNMSIVIPFIYDELKKSHDKGIFYAQIDARKFLMDLNQKEILDLSGYKRAGYFNDNVAVVIKDSDHSSTQWGLIDISSGKEILPCEYSVIRGPEYGVLTIQVKQDKGNDKYGLIGEDGFFLLEPIYDFMIILDEDFIQARKTLQPEQNLDEYFVFDHQGQEIFTTSYSPGVLGNMRKSGLFGITNLKAEPDLYGVIDKKGREVIPIKYESIDIDGFDQNGLLLVEYDNKNFYIDMNGVEYFSD